MMRLLLFSTLLIGMGGCTPTTNDASDAPVGYTVRMITVNPGHFHAGLVYKYAYDEVDPVVHIYAPGGKDLESHLALIDRFNTRKDRPTAWIPEVYEGEDYLERMLIDRSGNVMVVAGNNRRKIEYIRRAIEGGINVLADKPMVIRPDDFPVLKDALELADEKGLVVNDIMTERHEITSILQRELSQMEDVFGELIPGNQENPAITKESVHFFSKTVAGAPLIRPAWFFDVDQEGEAIVDVSTHLVDLILWQVFPGEPLDYDNPDDGVAVVSARVWDTSLTPSQFEKVTRQASYPDYLLPKVDRDSVLNVTASGEFVFHVRGVYGKVSVSWGFENPTGGDTHFSMMRGTRANLVIRQNEPQNFRATLYAQPADAADNEAFGEMLNRALVSLDTQYPGLTAMQSEFGWEIEIPDEFREGHEDHFTRVTEQYLEYLEEGRLPAWERANLLTKYYITTQAYAMAR